METTLTSNTLIHINNLKSTLLNLLNVLTQFQIGLFHCCQMQT